MPADANFRTAVDILDRLDPARIFSTKLLDRLMPRSPDLTGDGIVDTADLSDMLTSWGPGSSPADLVINQEVGGEDMGHLLINWGPLPL
jgi:hypothetical protein